MEQVEHPVKVGVLYKTISNPRALESCYRAHLEILARAHGWGFYTDPADVGIDFVLVKETSGQPIRVIPIQQKGRFTINRKYIGRQIYMAWPITKEMIWHIAPHDQMLSMATEIGYTQSKTWLETGQYSLLTMSRQLWQMLEPYRADRVLAG